MYLTKSLSYITDTIEEIRKRKKRPTRDSLTSAVTSKHVLINDVAKELLNGLLNSKIVYEKKDGKGKESLLFTRS